MRTQKRQAVFLLAMVVVLFILSTAVSANVIEHGATVPETPTSHFPTSVVVPIRWCALAGAPTQVDPTLVGDATIRDVLWRRHERPTDNHYDQALITFRSGATAALPAFPILIDMNISTGSQPGDVMDNDFDGGAEFNAVINQCRMAWSTAAPTVTGITAVHIRRFVDDTGAPTNLGGLGGRGNPSNAGEQMIAGRAMVIDNAYTFPTSPLRIFAADPQDKLTGHEFGHALSLPHGDGIDGDSDGVLDNEGDTLDGPNLMQYRTPPTLTSLNGSELTMAQSTQARDQALLHIPDATTTAAPPHAPGGELERALGNTAVDPIGDARDERGYLDISEFGAAVDPSIQTVYLLANTFMPIPDEIPGLGVSFLVDADGDPETGGDSADLDMDGVPSASGVEFIAVLDVFSNEEGRARVFGWTGQFFEEIDDPDIVIQIIPQQVYHDDFTELRDLTFIASHTVQVLMPVGSVPMIEDDFRMVVGVTDENGTLVERTENELTFRVEDWPECSVTPDPVDPGAEAVIHAEGLPSNVGVHALLGPDEVGEGETDEAGNTEIPFTVPTNALPGPRLVTIGVNHPTNAITADCMVQVNEGAPVIKWLPIIRRAP